MQNQETNISNQEKCKYLLPCGYCDKKGAPCDVFYAKTQPVTLNDLVYRQPAHDRDPEYMGLF